MLRKQGLGGRQSEIEAGFFQAMPSLTICLRICLKTGSPYCRSRQRGMCCISPSCLAQSQGVEVSLEQEGSLERKETSRANEASPMKTFTTKTFTNTAV